MHVRLLARGSPTQSRTYHIYSTSREPSKIKAGDRHRAIKHNPAHPPYNAQKIPDDFEVFEVLIWSRPRLTLPQKSFCGISFPFFSHEEELTQFRKVRQ
ncbi:uncharacterized protein H6S33_004088 [Morchella sextelata]|uniref:uncharacterized protein n=1 Tax=Morchella sextelata TaxID=1174677 RepID=UPI001D05684E|nr:uncharacterized protein H6S33_004088 [Morchella sextelata]KAH0606427.1 hypothetical protein H6S33_004088 [Morchella sextelata]